jgi:O-antigen ligase/polysaccharide polymerase Wzy-like membrane protein
MFGSLRSAHIFDLRQWVELARAPQSILIGLLLLDAFSREVIFRTPLYLNAAFSQPALRLQGLIVGVALLTLSAHVFRLRWLSGRLRFPILKFELLAVAMLGVAVIGAIVGLFYRNQWSYVVGDSYRLLVVPLAAFLTVELVRDVSAVRSVLIAYVLAAAFGSLLLGFDAARAVASGVSTYGLGVPSLLLLVFLLVTLTMQARTVQQQILVAANTTFVLLLSLVSLVRTSWGLTALAVGFVAIIQPRRALPRVAVVGAMTAVILGAVLLARPGSDGNVTAIIDQAGRRLGDALDPRLAPEQTMPGSSVLMLSSSLDLRRVEVREALTDLATAGPLAFLTGRGSGAEYPSALPIVDPTTKPGFRHQIHMTWVSILYRSGLIGFVLVVALVALVTWTAWNGLARAIRGGSPDKPLWAVIAVWMTVSAVGLTTVYGLIGDLTWGVMIGLLGVLARTNPSRVPASASTFRGTTHTTH